jgi:hypothetical protein
MVWPEKSVKVKPYSLVQFFRTRTNGQDEGVGRLPIPFPESPMLMDLPIRFEDNFTNIEFCSAAIFDLYHEIKIQ